MDEGTWHPTWLRPGRHNIDSGVILLEMPGEEAPPLGFEPKSPGPEPGSLSKLAYEGVVVESEGRA